MKISQQPLTKANIMIVDDMLDNLRFLSKVLTDKGYKVRSVPSGSRALKAARMTTDQQASFRMELSSGVQELAVARRRSLIGGGLASLVGAGLALLLRHNLVDRIYRITEAARRIQSGELGITVPVTSSDEIGILGQTFNQMTAQLRQIMQDLTRAKDSAVKAQQLAEAANQAKSTFLANMSHELRSPLNVILGFAQVMMREALTGNRSLPHKEHEHLGIILRSGEHLLTLINQVLDLSKIEAGGATLNAKSFDLHRLLLDVEDMFALRAENKGLYLLVAQDESIPQYVCTDEVKLRQVLINLLNNAVKFTEKGGIQLRMKDGESESIPNSQFVILHFSVADTGPGIAQDEIDKVFETFGQTETGRQAQEGTGLGLPISRKFVQLMGGDMRVESKTGHGTTFTFHIQVHVVDAADRETVGPTRRVIALEPEQRAADGALIKDGVPSGDGRYRILIVDDKQVNRQLLTELLNPLGFDMQEAKNGQEAIAIWEAWKPQLIWMDMRMPVLDGYEATKQIRRAEEQKIRRAEEQKIRRAEEQKIRRAEEQKRRQSEIDNQQSAIISRQSTKIIAVTASSFEEERAVVMSAGCDDFLRKPFTEMEIFEILRKHLGIRFVYEDVGARGTVPEPGAQSTVPLLTPEMLAALPAEWLAQLKKGAEEVDPDLLSSVLEQVRRHDAGFADALARLMDDFAYDDILFLIKEAQGEYV